MMYLHLVKDDSLKAAPDLLSAESNKVYFTLLNLFYVTCIHLGTKSSISSQRCLVLSLGQSLAFDDMKENLVGVLLPNSATLLQDLTLMPNFMEN